MTLSLTILGCGSSGGVPRPGGPNGLGEWGACDPANPKNRRMRSSVLVQRVGAGGKTTVLVDTSPDLREQLLMAQVNRIDAVLFSHDHADQTHGLDDLRPIFHWNRQPIKAYWDEETKASLLPRFAYAFEGAKGYPPIIDVQVMSDSGMEFQINGPGGPVPVVAIAQDHGGSKSLGFRFGPLAYSNDVVNLDERAFEFWLGLRSGWSIACATHRTRPIPTLKKLWAGLNGSNPSARS